MKWMKIAYVFVCFRKFTIIVKFHCSVLVLIYKYTDIWLDFIYVYKNLQGLIVNVKVVSSIANGRFYYFCFSVCKKNKARRWVPCGIHTIYWKLCKM